MQTFQLLIDQLVLGIHLSQQGEGGKKILRRGVDNGGYAWTKRMETVHHWGFYSGAHKKQKTDSNV